MVETRRTVYIETTVISYLRAWPSRDVIRLAQQQQTLSGMRMLDVGPAAPELAARLAREIQLPRRAQADALHVAIAATNGVNYLLTWNCRQLSNAVLRPRIESVCRANGFEPPRICTPPELMEDQP